MNRQGVVWLIIAAMLCAGIRPQVGLCFCTDCPCPGSLVSSNAVQWGEDRPKSCATCCHLPTPGQAVPCECRCSEDSSIGITAIRPAFPLACDSFNKLKKSCDWPTWNVAKDASWTVAPIMSRCQLAPHIQLPRAHLLLSVFLK